MNRGEREGEAFDVEHVGSAKPWAVGACGHRRGNSGASGAAVRTDCPHSVRAGSSCPTGGLGPF
jgi:hypothetical protein